MTVKISSHYLEQSAYLEGIEVIEESIYNKPWLLEVLILLKGLFGVVSMLSAQQV